VKIQPTSIEDLQAAARQRREDNKINWITSGFMLSFHIGAIAALFFFTWKAFFLVLFLWWVLGFMGIWMGF
jgi:stearoyl-CoA desaturase (delta-9 desaturase)